MKDRDPSLEPELEALLTSRKIERHAPIAVRTRALARAREFVAAGGRVLATRRAALVAAPVTRRRAPFQVALLASVAVAAAAVGTVVTLEQRPSDPHPVQVPPRTRAMTNAPEAPPGPAPAPSNSVAPPPHASAPVDAPRAVRVAPELDPFAAELDVMARAQAAYSHRDFSRALGLVAEHARRFPSGHLAEEREALRVRSLLASGRRDDGERAAAAFARRFPRSVLLPRAGVSQATK